MLIAQISDLHVAPDGSFIRGFVDSNALLARAVEYLNAMTSRPDLVLATGDLTDHGTDDGPDVLRATYGTPPYASSPTIIFLPHPPFETGVWWMDCIGRHQTAVALHPDCPPRMTTKPPMRALHQWTDDAFVSHATVFAHNGPELNIAQRLARGEGELLGAGPMPKGIRAIG